MLNKILNIIKNEYTINGKLDLWIFDDDYNNQHTFIIKYNELENKISIYQKEIEYYLDDINEYIEPIGFIKNVTNKDFINFLITFINNYNININNHIDKKIIFLLILYNNVI